MVKLRGFITCLLLFLSSYFGCVFMQGPFLFLMFLAPNVYRFWMDFTVSLWESYATALLIFVSGIKVKFYGDMPLPGERAILIMNHRTRLDWMYLWTWLHYYRCLQDEKIILKDGLNNIPGAGWAMQCASFIFLKRKWELDETLMTNLINYFDKCGIDLKILIFPEGTDMNDANKIRSNEFAVKNGLPQFEYLLQPRTTGFKHLHTLMNQKTPTAVYDLTVHYTGNFATKEIEFLKSQFPDSVQFFMKRFTPAEVAFQSSSNDLAKFVQRQWELKEKLLEELHQKDVHSTAMNEGLTGSYAPLNSESISQRVRLFLSFTLWTLFIVGSIYYVYISTWIAYLFVVLNVELSIFAYYLKFDKMVLQSFS